MMNILPAREGRDAGVKVGAGGKTVENMEIGGCWGAIFAFVRLVLGCWTRVSRMLLVE